MPCKWVSGTAVGISGHQRSWGGHASGSRDGSRAARNWGISMHVGLQREVLLRAVLGHRVRLGAVQRSVWVRHPKLPWCSLCMLPWVLPAADPFVLTCRMFLASQGSLLLSFGRRSRGFPQDFSPGPRDAGCCAPEGCFIPLQDNEDVQARCRPPGWGGRVELGAGGCLSPLPTPWLPAAHALPSPHPFPTTKILQKSCSALQSGSPWQPAQGYRTPSPSGMDPTSHSPPGSV